MPVSSIRIEDPYVIKLVQDEQRRSGEKTPTKTAQRMLIEHAAQREAREAEGDAETASPERVGTSPTVA